MHAMVCCVNFNRSHLCHLVSLTRIQNMLISYMTKPTLFYEKVQSILLYCLFGTVRDTSIEKLYQESGLESLTSRRWCRKLCDFYKILNEELLRI